MRYLIDGHNLINFLPNIALDDPHDEVKLVLKLRGFCAKKRRTRCTVIFDHGLPGGKSQLSTTDVEVVFASYLQTNADRILKERIREIKDIQGWTLVTSDNEVREEAIQRGMKALKSPEFVEILFPPKAVKPHVGINPNVVVPKDEVEDWLNEFGGEIDEDDIEEIDVLPSAPEPTHRKPIPKAITPSQKETPSASESLAKRAKAKPATPNPDLAQAREKRIQQKQSDVEHWLEVFGEDPAPEATDKPTKIVPRHKKGRKLKPEGKQELSAEMKSGDIELSENTVDAWIEVFGEQDKKREPTDPASQRSDPSKQGRYRNKDGKREPLVHKRMGTAPDIHLNEGEVDAWMDVFGVDAEEE